MKLVGHHPYAAQDSTAIHGELKALYDNIGYGKVHFILSDDHDQQLFSIKGNPTFVSGMSETREF